MRSKRGRALLLRRRNLLAEVAQALAQRRISHRGAGRRAKLVDASCGVPFGTQSPYQVEM